MMFNFLLRHSGNPGSTYRGLEQAIVLVTLQFNLLTLARLPDFYHQRDLNISSPASTSIAQYLPVSSITFGDGKRCQPPT